MDKVYRTQGQGLPAPRDKVYPYPGPRFTSTQYQRFTSTSTKFYQYPVPRFTRNQDQGLLVPRTKELLVHGQGTPSPGPRNS